MSRLIVKNLPKNVTETKLKELFSEKGIVTDVQLKYTEDRKFRRFGFVGYKTEDEASAALDFFHNSCIDTARITVERCAGLGDASKPKSWSKYAPDSKSSEAKEAPTSEPAEDGKKKKKSKKGKEEEEVDDKSGKKNKKDKEKENNKVKELLEKHKDDPLFEEFLESHTKGDKKIWSNNALLGDDNEEDPHEDKDSDDGGSGSEDESDSDEGEAIAKKNISDKEYMEALKKKSQGLKVKDIKEIDKKKGTTNFFTVKLNGLAYNHKKKDIKIFFKGMKPKSIRVPRKIKGIAYVGFKTEKLMKQALNKNKSFLDGKRIFVTKYEKSEKEEEKQDDKKGPNLRWKQQEEALKSEENVAESGRIFLRNLSYTATEDDIRKLFETYGPLSEVNLPIDMVTRKPKGFGTVTFLMPEHAVKAYSELDGSVLNGRMLHLLPAKTKTSPEDLLAQDGLSFKQKKELKAKAAAGSSHNWNTLFLGPNAVADAIANAYNTTKENVLQDGDNGASVAVRLALGETQLVQETQKFLEENGVHLNAFNQAPKARSKTVILVKNLPAGTHIREIREMFAKHGELGRVVLPPSGITALVEFIEPSEARKAFMRLAYSKFKHLPLYLEWAPDDSFTSAPPKSAKGKTDTADEKVRNNTKGNGAVKAEGGTDNKNEAKESDDEEDEDEPEPDTTLFVKNLDFRTTEEQLRKHFSKCGKLHYASVSTKKDPKNPGNKLSMGYGFVRYKFKSDCERALKELQTSNLDGKTLDLKRSERTLQTDVITTAKKTSKITEQTGTKILVRNVPFQANADEVKELFKAFGEIKSVRLPKKMVGEEKHRGFGFVEFYTKKEAKRAFKALCQSTHLYGRRLVLEWAQTDEGVEDLRKRTAKHFHEDISAKRSKKSTLDPESIGLEVDQSNK
ncbi:probable RNA-binding protein 19 [Nasonia vitripennis]|uniref:RRM domain-containing protein n=1 Tax=Nasonia vitripennis TaxID=7425 RepID=A0A7M7G5R0_NASVI|nr:probable RNA-binding protein 19 [Nasonia vitripennis]